MTSIPIPPLPDVCNAYRLIEKSKKVRFPSVPADQTLVFLLPPSQASYPLFASHNGYEWITLGSEEAPISPDINVILHNQDRSPIRSQITQVEGQIEVQRTTIDYNVESMSAERLCSYIQEFLKNFEEESSPEMNIVAVKSQPSHFRPLHDTSIPSNYKVMMGKFYGQALLRTISSQGTATRTRDIRRQDPSCVQPQDPEDYQTLLIQCLNHNQALFWQQAPAQRLQHILWLLWDDTTLLNLLRSKPMKKLANKRLPSELLTSICELHKALFPSPPSL
ncbi:hypothetical protein Plhal304r1_c029g0096341 [Plasmopara halstedii]